MKVRSKKIEKEFEPFDLTITVETRQDLINLWHRFNSSILELNSEHNSDKIPEAIHLSSDSDVFSEIDSIGKEYGIIKKTKQYTGCTNFF